MKEAQQIEETRWLHIDRFEEYGLLIEKLPAGPNRTFTRKNGKPDVAHTSIFVQIPPGYPCQPIRVFFNDLDIESNEIGKEGLHTFVTDKCVAENLILSAIKGARDRLLAEQASLQYEEPEFLEERTREQRDEDGRRKAIAL